MHPIEEKGHHIKSEAMLRTVKIQLIRQGVLLIPLALVMSRLIGLDGALLAAPVADTVTCLLCVALARTEFRRWEKAGML